MGDHHDPAGEGRFVARSLLGLGAVLVGGGLFALILALVVSDWPPLRAVDVGVVDWANAAVSQRPWAVSVLEFITNLGGSEAVWILLSVAVLWLLSRRLPRLAVYVAVTGLGAAVLIVGVKTLLGRARPMVDAHVFSASGASFPSGHAMGSTIAYGVLLLVFLPVVPARLRRFVVIAVTSLVVAIGFTRIALGVHYPSDVLAGWILGALWLTVTAVAFRRWRQEEGLPERPVRDGLAPGDRSSLAPAPAHDSSLPAGWFAVAGLVTAGVMIWGAFVGLGLSITDVPSLVRQVDVAVIEWFAQRRTPTLTSAFVAVSHLGSTNGIVIVLLVAVPLALGLTRRWAPALFLITATVGETTLFLAISTVVARARPEVDRLSPALPPTASFPSGHVAATVATYGGIALLFVAWKGASRVSYMVSALATFAIVGVALARVYRGVHYPSDTVASLLFTGAWLVVCWWAFRPERGSPWSANRGGAGNDLALWSSSFDSTWGTKR